MIYQFAVCRGVGMPQGSVLSPLLFILVLETLFREFRTGATWELPYADDLVERHTGGVHLQAQGVEPRLAWKVKDSVSTWRRPNSWSLMLAKCLLHPGGHLYILQIKVGLARCLVEFHLWMVKFLNMSHLQLFIETYSVTRSTPRVQTYAVPSLRSVKQSIQPWNSLANCFLGWYPYNLMNIHPPIIPQCY